MSETKMSDSDAIQTMHEAWDFFFNQCRIIAMMPVEEWIDQLNRADATAPILDPTLYRDWIYSGKREIFLKVFQAGLSLKRTIEEVQPKLRELLESQNKLGKVQ